MCAPYSLARSNHHQFNNHLKPTLKVLVVKVSSNHHQFNNHLKHMAFFPSELDVLIIINLTTI